MNAMSSPVGSPKKTETDDERNAREQRYAQAKKGAPVGDSSKSSGVKKGFARVREELKNTFAKKQGSETGDQRTARIAKLKEEKEDLELETSVQRLKHKKEALAKAAAADRQKKMQSVFGGGNEGSIEDQITGFYLGSGSMMRSNPVSDGGRGDQAWNSYYGLGSDPITKGFSAFNNRDTETEQFAMKQGGGFDLDRYNQLFNSGSTKKKGGKSFDGNIMRMP